MIRSYYIIVILYMTVSKVFAQSPISKLFFDIPIDSIDYEDRYLTKGNSRYFEFESNRLRLLRKHYDSKISPININVGTSADMEYEHDWFVYIDSTSIEDSIFLFREIRFVLEYDNSKSWRKDFKTIKNDFKNCKGNNKKIRYGKGTGKRGNFKGDEIAEWDTKVGLQLFQTSHFFPNIEIKKRAYLFNKEGQLHEIIMMYRKFIGKTL